MDLVESISCRLCYKSKNKTERREENSMKKIFVEHDGKKRKWYECVERHTDR